MDDLARSTTLTAAASQLVHRRRVASVSNPEPALREYNVLAVYPSIETARQAVLDLEGIDDSDAAVGLVVFGADDETPRGKVDPEGVTGAVVPRILTGGLIGLVVGAVLVGGGALLFGAGGAAIGAALGGGAMGFTFGAIWASFARLGGSDAFRQSFVATSGDDVSVVSLHTDDRHEAEAGRARLRGGGQIHVVGVDGRPRSDL